MSRLRRYVITCQSGCQWLVLSTTSGAALADWPASAEPARNAWRASRADIHYLRRIGHADQGA